MKKIYLIRHAKASWDNLHLADIDRPLTEQGKTDAHWTGQQLKEQKIKPDVIVSSPAKRSLDTAEIIAEEIKYPLKKIVTLPQIYNAGVETLITAMQELDNQFNTALFFGHNPTLTWLAHYLCDDFKPNISTCGVVGIEFVADNWANITESEGKFLFFLHPPHENHA